MLFSQIKKTATKAPINKLTIGIAKVFKKHKNIKKYQNTQNIQTRIHKKNQ